MSKPLANLPSYSKAFTKLNEATLMQERNRKPELVRFVKNTTPMQVLQNDDSSCYTRQLQQMHNPKKRKSKTPQQPQRYQQQPRQSFHYEEPQQPRSSPRQQQSGMIQHLKRKRRKGDSRASHLHAHKRRKTT